MKMPTLTEILGLPKTPFTREVVTEEASKPTPESLGEKKVLFTWRSSARPQRNKFSQKFIKTGIVIGVVLGLLLIIMQEFFLILVVASLIFISYILQNSPVDEVDNELSTHGVSTAGQVYYWYDLSQFFFKKSGDTNLLAVDTKRGLPGRLFIAYNPADHDTIRNIVSKYLLFLDHEPMTSVDKAYYRLMDKLNFDDK